MAKKLTKILVVGFAALLGLAVVAFLWVVGLPQLVFLGVWIGSGEDLTSAQDEDMQFSRTAIPEAENAFSLIQEAVQKLQLGEKIDKWGEEKTLRIPGPKLTLDLPVPPAPEEEEKLAEEYKLMMDFVAGTEASSPAATEILFANQDALAALDKALEIGRLQLPETPDGQTKMPFSLIDWRRLGCLLCLRARSRLEKGDTEAAFDDALSLLRFGHMVEGAQGSYLTYLSSKMIKSMALGEVRLYLAKRDLSSTELEPLVAELESLRPNARFFREAMKWDYTFMGPACDREFEDSLDDESKSLRDEPFMYKKNSTRKLFVDRYREISDSFEKNCSQIHTSDPDPVRERLKIVLTFWQGNISGRTLFSLSGPTLATYPLEKCFMQTEFSATQVLVALRQYQADHGETAPSLEMLVPEYLAAVPVDDFDGQPLRYVPQERLIYSVGEDLTDGGADREKDRVWLMGY